MNSDYKTIATPNVNSLLCLRSVLYFPQVKPRDTFEVLLKASQG